MRSCPCLIQGGVWLSAGTHEMTDDVKKLKEMYVARQMEPHAEEDSWTPDDNYATLKN